MHHSFRQNRDHERSFRARTAHPPSELEKQFALFGAIPHKTIKIRKRDKQTISPLDAYERSAQLMQKIFFNVFNPPTSLGRKPGWQRAAFIEKREGLAPSRSVVLQMNTSLNVTQDLWDEILSCLCQHGPLLQHFQEVAKPAKMGRGSMQNFTHRAEARALFGLLEQKSIRPGKHYVTFSEEVERQGGGIEGIKAAITQGIFPEMSFTAQLNTEADAAYRQTIAAVERLKRETAPIFPRGYSLEHMEVGLSHNPDRISFNGEQNLNIAIKFCVVEHTPEGKRPLTVPFFDGEHRSKELVLNVHVGVSSALNSLVSIGDLDRGVSSQLGFLSRALVADRFLAECIHQDRFLPPESFFKYTQYACKLPPGVSAEAEAKNDHQPPGALAFARHGGGGGGGSSAIAAHAPRAP